MKRLFFLSLIFAGKLCFAQQGINTWWDVGYGSYDGPPFGHITMDFFNGNVVYGTDSIGIDFDRTSANIADVNGNVLFYCNGFAVADASGDTMQNGNNISPTGFNIFAPYGLTIAQASLILPKGNNQFYLFHSTVDNAPNYNRALKLYYSIIDMSLNGGLGAVINKNTVLLQDTLSTGKLTACKHANGRDWWLILRKEDSNKFYKYLVLSSAILGPYIQNIGTTEFRPLGMACFSPDGKKYASFHAEYTTTGGLDIYDFDRCTATLSNPVHIIIPQSLGFSGGLAFSANSKYLYVANIEKLFQFDMNASNIATSQLTVAVWDSFYSPNPPFATIFEIMQLAPDGKIYITTGNSTFHMHVINEPDSAGLACDVQQHSIQFQYWYANGIPNHPNYFLGCDTTQVNCACLTSLLPNPSFEGAFSARAAPNPTRGDFILQFNVEGIAGTLEIYDVMGNVVMRDYVAPWSQIKKVDISNMASGVYFVKVKWGNTVASVKIVKE